MIPPVPHLPSRYDDEEQRLQRLEALERASRRRGLLVVLGGALLPGALIPLTRAGWGGAGLLLAPLGLGLVLGGAIQLLLARCSS